MDAADELYPLTFEPIYKEKVWGGRSLEKLGRALPGDKTTRIGESWELADLATTSVSGGGGNAEHSVVANGPLAGKTIRELMQTHGEALLGPGVAPSSDGGFPLLIKFLDARANLSVQVHPSPEYAAAHRGAHLKSEAWYVIDAAPGAVIYKGLKPGVTEDRLREALRVNTDEAVVPLLNAIEVRAGDCHYLPSGTLHALGAGVLVAEVQTPSDTTFRVYDWGRTDRELHIEQALACIDFGPEEKGRESFVADSRNTIPDPFHSELKAACDHFHLHGVVCSAASREQVRVQQQSAEIWIGLEGLAVIVFEGGASLQLVPGLSVLLPAVSSSYRLASQGGGHWLRVTLP
ncbi:MAG: type I phosphomannose isomerase catalytic subunit [Phycisphaeraceae bacterium]